jgi:hypothetical protein
MGQNEGAPQWDAIAKYAVVFPKMPHSILICQFGMQAANLYLLGRNGRDLRAWELASAVSLDPAEQPLVRDLRHAGCSRMHDTVPT